MREILNGRCFAYLNLLFIFFLKNGVDVGCVINSVVSIANHFQPHANAARDSHIQPITLEAFTMIICYIPMSMFASVHYAAREWVIICSRSQSHTIDILALKSQAICTVHVFVFLNHKIIIKFHIDLFIGVINILFNFARKQQHNNKYCWFETKQNVNQGCATTRARDHIH